MATGESPVRIFGAAPILLALLLALGSCSRKAPPAPEPPPPPTNAVEAGIKRGPSLKALDPGQAERAGRAFAISCPTLLRRADTSGLTRPEDWKRACDAATAMTDARPERWVRFFRGNFETVEVGDGKAFVTGYFEPEIAGSREHVQGYDVPIYAKPDDLVESDPATAAARDTIRRGRLENGIMVPYYERSEIEDGILAGRGLEIAWAADPIDFFFLQIQGSGRLKLPDGSIMRIGYASQNGRDYVGIGKLMKDRGLLAPGHTKMQDLVAWLRDHPEEGRAIMRENKSYVFFRELTGPGPLGGMGHPITPRGSVATDPRFVPLGAPVLLKLDRAEANGLWVAQDTGGAIKGTNRFDTFWGAGEDAARIAGGMVGRGTALLLLPKGTVARLHAPAQR